MSDQPGHSDARVTEDQPAMRRQKGRRAISWQTATAFLVFLAVIAGIAIAIGIYVHSLVGH